MSQHWDEYWSQGHTTSFGNTLKNNYEGKLAALWNDIFSNFADDFEALDVCSGNGSLPLLLNEQIKNRAINGRIIGVDLAEVKLNVATDKRQPNLQIELMSKVNCEDLPFESARFEYCISQFGIEYSNLIKTIKEIGRVLKVNGEAHLVLHHSNSIVLKKNRSILAFNQRQEIFAIISLMRKMVVAMGEVSGPEDINRIKKDPHCEALRAELNILIKKIVEINEDEAKESDFMAYVGQFFKIGMFWPQSKKLEYIDFIENQIKQSSLRLEELLDAAVDEDSLSRILSELRCSSLELRKLLTVEYDEGGIWGWYLNLVKF